MPNRMRERCLAVLALLVIGFFARGVILSSRQIGPGINVEMQTFAGERFRVVSLEPKKSSIELIWKRTDGSQINSFDAAIRYEASIGKRVLFSTNAGIFNGDREPAGLLIINGQTLVRLNTKRGAGNFYLQPNGVFALGEEDAFVTTTAAFKQEHIRFATQSGPMLVIEGQVNSAFDPASKNRTIRSGIGVDSRGRILVAISESPVTFNELASLFLERLRCRNALYLDGTISKSFIDGVDSPYSGSERFGAILIATE